MLKGNVMSALGMLTEAQKYFEDAIAQASELSPDQIDPDQETEANIALQLCLHAQGKNEEALSALLQLEREKQHSTEIMACLHHSLGNVYRSTANWHSAQLHLSKAIEIAVTINDGIKCTEWTFELGRVYRSSGLHQKALEMQWKAFQESLDRGNMALCASICGEIGFTYYSLKQPNHEEAVSYLGVRILLASNVLHDQAGVRWCLNNLGKSYHSMGLLEQAIKCFKESLELVKGTGNLLGEGTALGNLGSVLRDAGQYREAIKHHRLYLINAGKRLDIGGEAIMLRELALDFFLMGDYAQCQENALQGLFTLEKMRSFLMQTDDQLKLGNHEKNEARMYNILQIALNKLGQHEEALLVSELGRARAVFDLMKKRKQKIGLPSFSVDKLELITNMSGTGFDRHKVEQKCNMVKNTAAVMMANILVYSIVEEPVLQHQSEKWLYIWVIQKDGIHFNKKTISSSAGLTHQSLEKDYISTLRRDIGLKKKVTKNLKPQANNDVVKDSNLSQSVKPSVVDPYQYLIAPIEKHLKSCLPRLVIVPYGFLYLIPFASLKDSSNHFLVERFAISYAQSISILSLLINSSKSLNLQLHSDPLIIGNPTMPSPGIDQLSGAEEEAKCIESIIGGHIILRENATKERVCKAIMGRSLVHFATHALLGDSVAEHEEVVDADQVKIADVTGDYSVKGAIVLAKSNHLCSGILTSSEVQGLDLSACQLLTLSCCRTACGKVSGDGVLGLSRALLVAGTSCIVNTLWAIEDKATVHLMRVFYAKYKETNDAALALRAAMLELISVGYEVDDWSAFCVTGVTIGMVNVRK